MSWCYDEIGRDASGDWVPGNPYVRVRIEADPLEQPQDLSIAPSDVRVFVIPLLAFSGKAGTGGHPSAVAEKALPSPRFRGLDVMSVPRARQRWRGHARRSPTPEFR
jgi:hypothetical protein